MKFSPLFLVLCASVAVIPNYNSYAADKQIPVETVLTVQDKADDDLLKNLPLSEANDEFLSVLTATYENNPSLKSATAETRALFQQLPIADSAWKPRVTADGSVTASENKNDPGDTDNLTTSVGEINVTQSLFGGGRTVADINGAQSSIRAGIARLEKSTSDILLEAITAYTDIVIASSRVDLNENNMKVLAKQMDATRTRFRVGDVTKTDVAQAESRFAKAQADVSAARAAYKTARANFVNITGVDTLPSNLPASTVPMPESFEIALQTAQDWSPSLRAAVHEKRAAGYEVNSRLGAHLPEVSLRGGVSTTRDPSPLLDQQDNAQIGVVATIPLYEGGATTARVRQARQTFNARTADVDDAFNAVTSDVTRLWGEWQAAMDEIDAREAQVKAARVAQFGTSKEAEFGARSVLDTLDSNQELLDAELALLTARRNEVVTRFGLLASMGMLSPKILGFGAKMPDFNREISRTRRGF